MYCNTPIHLTVEGGLDTDYWKVVNGQTVGVFCDAYCSNHYEENLTRTKRGGLGGIT